jgi:hypothetical protein
MLVHKTCPLSDAPEGEKRRGVYLQGSVSTSFDLFNTPSGQGGVQILLANDYSIGEGGAYITSIECYDCNETVESFPDIESYKLERYLDANPEEYDLMEEA